LSSDSLKFSREIYLLMHIKLVVNSFPTASETFLFNLVTGLEKRGIKITVCATTRSEDDALYAHKLKEWSRNLQLVSLKPGSFSNIVQIATLVITNPLFFLKNIRQKGIRKGLRDFLNTCFLLKGKPDIVHFSFSGIGITYLDCLPGLQKQSVKTVVSCRGTAEKVKPLLEPKRREKLQLLFSQVDLIHCVSKDMRDGLVRFGLVPAKAFINYPSIETNNFCKSNSKLMDAPGKYMIVTIGRLHFQKGYVYALQALKKLVEKNIPFTYNILGEGPDRPMLTYLIQEWGLSDQVVLHGKVDSEQVLKILNISNVFLLPSLYEGVSNAVLEAMAMELPILTTRAGGMAEVIMDKVNGLLTDWKTTDHMGDQLVWLYENPAAGIEMGKKAKKTVDELFSSDRQIDIFIDQYKTILHVG
jgi:colanic acid/amylovoran biosynthesis glycosyltransferase